MKRWILTVALVAAFAPAALAASPDATKNASTDCTALKATMGATSFGQAYATFGACVSKYAQLEQQNQTSANATCQALQSKKGNAFGVCVSQAAKASSQAERQSRTNAAQTCRASRTSLGAQAFGQKYGTTSANTKNAMGKCVSQTAHAAAQAELRASAACLTEQNADVQAFQQKYGTNADKTNAFGKCVAGKK